MQLGFWPPPLTSLGSTTSGDGEARSPPPTPSGGAFHHPHPRPSSPHRHSVPTPLDPFPFLSSVFSSRRPTLHALARLCGSVDTEISQCVEKAEAAKQEATVVTLNAEIRRAKAKLLEEDLPKLQSLALKKDEVVNPLFEKRPKQFGISGALPPKKDLHRFVNWPKVMRIQRQCRILKQRLKVPQALHQFTRTLDKNIGHFVKAAKGRSGGFGTRPVIESMLSPPWKDLNSA
ncbi:uncharacterized protein [Triticum aestivum]|uniref:uncharacterized protein n=1 Tax=Triticum aestivum TaxID=4565 RepID=UPI001D02C876|nr:uncharacterized protein LOC123142573 [Triticum aestivum]